MTHKLAVLVQDDSTNLLCLLDAINTRKLDALVLLVVTDTRGSVAQDRAEDQGIPTLYHPRDWYEITARSEAEYLTDLLDAVRRAGAEQLLLDGWPLETFAACHNTLPITVLNQFLPH